ncbi:MAG TPA: TolC family protein, partial [Anseongella sp.]
MITHYRFFLHLVKRYATGASAALGLLFISTGATGQQHLTLQECIEYAVENNLDIEQARINERISDVDYRQSKYDLLPDLNGSASHSISFGRSVNPITDVIDDQRISAGGFNLNANLLLFSGFQRLNSIAQARYAMMSNQTAVERIKQQVMVNVAA